MNTRPTVSHQTGSGGDRSRAPGSWNLEGLIAALAVLLGACCLLTAATGLTSPRWLSPLVSGFLLAWAPVLCLAVLGGLGVLLAQPKALRVSAVTRRTLLVALTVVGIMGLIWVWRFIMSH